MARAEFKRPIQAGELGCYRCGEVFPVPPLDPRYVNTSLESVSRRFHDVTCPGAECGAIDSYEHYRAHPSDPNKHPLGWPYDDPTVPYDC